MPHYDHKSASLSSHPSSKTFSSHSHSITFGNSNSLDPKMFYVVTAISNPLLWKSRIDAYREFEKHMIDSGVNLYTVECVYGERPFQCAGTPGVVHIGVRAETLAWNKENLLNIGISRLPLDAKYIGTFDADIKFRKKTWVSDTLNALQLYDVIQPWSNCYDLGPNDEHINHHVSFVRQYFHGHPVVPGGPNFWAHSGGKHDYPHSGYAWAWRRSALDKIGGLFELGGMGSGDHHMALSLVDKAEYSVPKGATDNYLQSLYTWRDRAVKFANFNIGYIQGTIEHFFHGRKHDRKYVDRWDMFLKHNFDPHVDLHKNTCGVIEFASHKPELKREFDLYLRSRNEDINSL